MTPTAALPIRNPGSQIQYTLPVKTNQLPNRLESIPPDEYFRPRVLFLKVSSELDHFNGQMCSVGSISSTMTHFHLCSQVCKKCPRSEHLSTLVEEPLVKTSKHELNSNVNLSKINGFHRTKCSLYYFSIKTNKGKKHN